MALRAIYIHFEIPLFFDSPCSVLNVKAVVAAFNQEKALVGAFSVITNLRMTLFEALVTTISVSSFLQWTGCILAADCVIKLCVVVASGQSEHRTGWETRSK